MVLAIDASGGLSDPQRIAGGDGSAESLFQPLWSRMDSCWWRRITSGWWTPQRWCGSAAGATIAAVAAGHEAAAPQWVYGMHSAATKSALLALACAQGEWASGSPWQQQQWQRIALPFNELSGLTASAQRAVVWAPRPQRTTLLELDLAAAIIASSRSPCPGAGVHQ